MKSKTSSLEERLRPNEDGKMGNKMQADTHVVHDRGAHCPVRINTVVVNYHFSHCCLSLSCPITGLVFRLLPLSDSSAFSGLYHNHHN